MELDHLSHVGSEEFQSPICRGRRCNNETLPANQYRGLFQSPIRRGSRCNRPLQPVSLPIEVSVPYSSGQSLQSSAAPHRHWSWHGFSPLFVGAVVAIRGVRVQSYATSVVSVPYSSGQSLQYGEVREPDLIQFQSPICRGRRCNCRTRRAIQLPLWFQSPICRGRRCNGTKRG